VIFENQCSGAFTNQCSGIDRFIIGVGKEWHGELDKVRIRDSVPEGSDND